MSNNNDGLGLLKMFALVEEMFDVDALTVCLRIDQFVSSLIKSLKYFFHIAQMYY